MMPNLLDATRFLNLVDPAAPSFTFQTFDDNKERRAKRQSDPLARIIEGSLEEVAGQLQSLNEKGAGVYVTVNETRLDGSRKVESITRVRAVFADLDGAPADPVKTYELRPHLMVESSPNRYQAFWLVDSLPLDKFREVQEAIATRFSADLSVKDLPRVMRVPGFFHRKGIPFKTRILDCNEALPRYSADAVLAAFTCDQVSTTLVSKYNADQSLARPLIKSEIPEGTRNAMLLSMAGQLRGKGLGQDAIDRHLLDANASRCKPPLSEDEVLQIARRYAAAPSTGPQGLVWGKVEAIPTNLPPVPAFDPVAMLPATLAPWVIDIAERMQCPVDYVGVAMMVACGAVLGNKIAVRPKRVDTWHEVPNLWGIIIGRSGDKKTPAVSDALGPLRQLQEQATIAHSQVLSQYAFDLVQHKINLATKQSKAKSGKYSLTPNDLIEPVRPPERRYIVNDTTVEALGLILQSNPIGTLAFADEVVGLLSRLEGEEQRPARAFYLEAYNGKNSFSVDRISRDRVFIPRLCLSVLGTTQPDALRQHIRQAVYGGTGNDGLIQRFQLCVYPDRMSGAVRIVDKAPDSQAQAMANGVFSYLDALDASAVGAESGDPVIFPLST